MIDRLRQIAIFAKVVDHGSFRGAASELNLSPSVVSHHVSELESYLGVALLYRTTRKLTLSKEGERLLAVSNDMLTAVEGELKEISGTSSEPSGELRATIPAILCDSKLTDAIADFSKSYPKIRLKLDYSDSYKELIDDGFDVAIRMWLNPKKTETTQKLFGLERRFVASPTFLENQPKLSHPAQIEDGLLLALSPVHNMGISFFKEGNEKIKIKPKPRLHSNDAQSLLKFAKSGLGFAALPAILVDEAVRSNELNYVLSDWRLTSLTVFAEWPVNAPRKGLISLFVDKLSKYDYITAPLDRL